MRQGRSGAIDLASGFTAEAVGQKRTVKVPLTCFAERGADLGSVEEPFSVAADAPFAAAFTNIKVVSGTADDADALKCGKAAE